MRAAVKAWLSLFLLGAFLLVAPGGIARAQNYDFPQLTGRVVDEANLLDAAARIDLETKLETLEKQSTTQFVVVTLKSLRGRTIEEYGYQLGRHWGIGQKGSNNGVLLIVAPNERKVRIEVGYGLEGTLTDAITSVIIQSVILPRFRANDYAGGIQNGADAVIKVLEGGGDEFKRQAPVAETVGTFGMFVGVLLAFLFQWPGILLLIIFLHFFVQFVRKLFEWLGLSKPMTPQERRRRARNDWGWVVPTGGSSWGGGSDSGWSSGGGGFSGGGGSFGGGGSSGSW
jgi:uncharacterized protein